ncbi:hypothetical protein P3T97_14180 (plasmid) [Mammaliicoccus sciuri]|uniref:hypothetical protein n=1 Tax=Mammaliicoccus sciuri TaxID=1296 RepID=UPI000E69447F|nr:hypothetical protein [Mammaliicoccus sciuri]RIN97106.1 hypothetical protein BU002_01965 [Mammaliicoccus sciuri]WQJ67266.1 hypothetical protein P3T97_14180 [Mammaliicoccus sciuri]
MKEFEYRIEQLDKAIEYVNNNKNNIDLSDREKVYYEASIRSIRGDIKVTNRYMLDNLEELSKDDIKILLEKIVAIEYKFS